MRVKGAVALLLGLAWCAQGAMPPAPVPAAATPPGPIPAAGPGDLVISLRWETPGTDIDLSVAGPNGRQVPPVRDVTNGPGEEVCVIRNPAPGDYRIQAMCFNGPADQAIPVTARVQLGGREEGPFQGTVARRGGRTIVHTFRVPGGAGGAGAPGSDVTIRVRWETRGTDIDLYVFDTNGERYPVVDDVTDGPGEETCILRNAAPGEYRIEALYCGPQGGPPTPVTVQTEVAGKAEGPYRATVQRAGEQALVHTLTLLPKAGAAPVRNLVVTLRWETRGTDVDLIVTDPNGQRREVLNDITSGPGQETCIIHNPAPGDYRIEAVYVDTSGGQTTPVTVEVKLGDRAVGTHQAALRRPDERVLIQTVPVPAQPQGAAPEGRASLLPSQSLASGTSAVRRIRPPGESRPGDPLLRRTAQQPDPGVLVPGSSLSVMLQWETRGTDIDLVVINPRGQRCAPFNDVTQGPGRETVVVRQPLPGDYRIEAHYFSDRGGETTPVAVEVRRDGRLEGVYRATLQRRGEQILVHTVRF